MEVRRGDVLTPAEAAEALGVQVDSVRKLAGRGVLTRVEVGPGRYGYVRSEVYLYGERRPHAAHKGMPSDIQRWGRRNRPVEHTDLVGTREAAAMLGVTMSAVRGLVARGLLPCYQSDPCKSGCRMRIPRYWVEAVAARPAYQSRREARERRVGMVASSEELGIPAAPRRGWTRSCERDYGAWYTTRQAANVLGISRQAVRVLLRRGRLEGGSRTPERDLYAAPKRGYGYRWLFYPKESVHALLRDAEYMERRARGVKLRVEERRGEESRGERNGGRGERRRSARREAAAWPEGFYGSPVNLERILR